jgi:hypothetical protein
MPFPDPDERPGDERRFRIEFDLLLGALVLTIVLSARWLWHELTSLF